MDYSIKDNSSFLTTPLNLIKKIFEKKIGSFCINFLGKIKRKKATKKTVIFFHYEKKGCKQSAAAIDPQEKKQKTKHTFDRQKRLMIVGEQKKIWKNEGAPLARQTSGHSSFPSFFAVPEESKKKAGRREKKTNCDSYHFRGLRNWCSSKIFLPIFSSMLHINTFLVGEKKGNKEVLIARYFSAFRQLFFHFFSHNFFKGQTKTIERKFDVAKKEKLRDLLPTPELNCEWKKEDEKEYSVNFKYDLIFLNGAIRKIWEKKKA